MPCTSCIFLSLSSRASFNSWFLLSFSFTAANLSWTGYQNILVVVVPIRDSKRDSLVLQNISFNFQKYSPVQAKLRRPYRQLEASLLFLPSLLLLLHDDQPSCALRLIQAFQDRMGQVPGHCSWKPLPGYWKLWHMNNCDTNFSAEEVRKNDGELWDVSLCSGANRNQRIRRVLLPCIGWWFRRALFFLAHKFPWYNIHL